MKLSALDRAYLETTGRSTLPPDEIDRDLDWELLPQSTLKGLLLATGNPCSSELLESRERYDRLLQAEREFSRRKLRVLESREILAVGFDSCGMDDHARVTRQGKNKGLTHLDVRSLDRLRQQVESRQKDL